MARDRRREQKRRRGAESAAGAVAGPRLWPWLVLVTLLAAGLRMAELGTWSFWIDEAHTFRDATMPFAGEAGFLRQDRALYPLTFLGLRVLLDAGWIGDSEGWLRLPFALVGIATVPLSWWLGRRLIGDGAAVVAALLLAVMPWHVFWSQNARGYVFVVLSAAIAGGMAWRWVETQRARDLVMALLAILLGALFHPTAAFQAVGLLAFVLLRHLRELRMRVVVWVLIGVALSVLLLPTVIRTFSPIQGFLRTKTDTSVLHLVLTTGYYFRPLLLVAAIAGLVLVHRRHGRERALFLGCLAGMPFFVLAVVGGTVAQTTARYAICALPALIWLAAAAACELARLVSPERTRAVRVLGAFLGLCLVADFAGGTWHYFADQHGDRARWREACQFVRERGGDKPIYALSINEPTVTYYLCRRFWADGGAKSDPIKVRVLVGWLVDGILDDEEKTVIHPPGGRHHLQWQRAQAGKAEMFVFVTMPELAEIDRDGSLWRALRTDFELVLHLPCWVGPKDESIYVFAPIRS